MVTTKKHAHKKNKLANEKRGAPKNPSQNYVDNEAFYAACLSHYNANQAAIKAGKPSPQVSEYIGKCLLNICRKLGTSRHFHRYAFLDDMVMDAVENCLQYFNNFDPIKYKNPFAYFTQIAYYAFLRRIGKERDRIYNQYKLASNKRFGSYNPIENIFDEDGPVQQFQPNADDEGTDAMKEFVQKYEAAAKKRKVDAAAKKKAKEAAK